MLGAVRGAGGIDRVEALQEGTESLCEPDLLHLVESERQFAGHPRQDGPGARECLAGFTESNDFRDGTGNLGGDVGQPANLLEQVRDVRVRPG